MSVPASDQASQLEAMQKQLAELQATIQDMASSKMLLDQPDSESGEQGEVDNQLQWSDIIKTQQVEAQDPQARAMVRLLGAPPPLSQLKASAPQIVRYAGIPETPAPRRNRIDQQLFGAQAKFESILHLLVHHQETGNNGALGAAAAFARSGFEDIHQQRRHLLAGKQSWKLGPRSDDTRPRLLTQEEEKKIVPERQPRQTTRNVGGGGGWTSQNSQRQWIPRPRSHSQGKGKGKPKPKWMQK